MTKILTFDLEIAKPISAAGGWDAARRGDCGISVLCIKDSETGRFYLFDEHTMDAAVDMLNSADLLVSFNGIDFDANVIFGVTGRYLTVPHYDILKEIWSALKCRKKGYKLDEVAQATIGMGKSGHGEFATTLAAQNRYAELHDYCIGDVHITAHLFDHIIDSGFIKGADGLELFLEKPLVGAKDYA